MKKRGAMLQYVAIAIFIGGCTTPGIRENAVGLEHLYRGRFAEAETQFRQALRANRKDANFHNNLGLAFWEQGRVQEAAAEFREAIRLDKRHSLAHRHLGMVYQAEGRFSDAKCEMEEALASARTADERPYLQYVDVCLDDGNLEAAIRYLEGIRKRTRPSDLETINTYFIATQALVYAQIADGSYREAISLASDNLAALDKTKTERGGYVIPIVTPWFFSITSVPKVQFDLAPIHGSFFNLRGVAYMDSGAWATAADDFTRARDKGVYYGILNLGLTRLEAGDALEASHLFRQFIDEEPRNAMARVYYAIALKLAGHDEAAATALADANARVMTRLNLNAPTSAPFVEAVAYADQVWNRLQGATDGYKRAIQLAPKSGWAYRQLAQVHLKMGNVDEARILLTKADDLMPDDARTRTLLSEVR